MTSAPNLLPRCLIGTLYTGEKELAASEAALASQSYMNWQRFRIDHKPEAMAHCELYRRFEAESGAFDLFLKIDADMILTDTNVLTRIVHYLGERSRVDHACFAVRDYMSSMLMMGLHVFTPRARWPTPAPKYHPDPNPAIPGMRLEVWDTPAPVAEHASDPSPYQAFHFGAHRTLKALHGRSASARRRQWDVLAHVARHAQRNSDPRLRLALLASWHMAQGDMSDHADDVINEDKQALFERYHNCTGLDLDDLLPANWTRELIARGKRKSWLRRRLKHYQRIRRARQCRDHSLR